MTITRSTDYKIGPRQYRRKWGFWEYRQHGLLNAKADYLIPWSTINHATDVFAWLIQISGKNTCVYGETAFADLMKAFQEVFGLYAMHDSAIPIDGSAKARSYQAKLKEQSSETRF